MYDPKCEEVAIWFLEDEPELKPKLRELSQVIQDCIEDWIAEQRIG